MRFGPTELFIILLIVLVLFGGGRIARLGSELGEAVSSFRNGLSSGDEDGEEKEGEAVDVKASENGKEPV